MRVLIFCKFILQINNKKQFEIDKDMEEIRLKIFSE